MVKQYATTCSSETGFPVAHILKVLEITEIWRNILCDGDSVAVLKNKKLPGDNIIEARERVDRLFERPICLSQIELPVIVANVTHVLKMNFIKIMNEYRYYNEYH